MTTVAMNLKDMTVLFEDSPEAHKEVFDYLVQNFYKKYQSFDGETICQSDDCMIEAHQVLAEIADSIIGFEVVYYDE